MALFMERYINQIQFLPNPILLPTSMVIILLRIFIMVNQENLRLARQKLIMVLIRDLETEILK